MQKTPELIRSSTGSILATCSAKEIPGYWPIVREILKPAVEMSDETYQGIYEDLLSSRAQLWMTYSTHIEAALVTKIQTDSKGRFCLLLSCAGENLKGWSEFVEHVERWARDRGCTETRLYGRRGWAKVLGMDVVHTKMVKKL